MPPTLTIYTVGHSTRSLEELTAILRERGVTLLADVRTAPHSRHNPQFNAETLPTALADGGIAYRHIKELGGLRRPMADSPNCGWHNDSFRGFADYMLTDSFTDGLALLIDLAGCETIAVMCAETVPWRCHRSLLSDALVIRGIRVEHLISPGHSRPHRLTPFAQVDGLAITYPGSC
jgi:uncharacterized protein (DUF488 family)